ncbi:T9SS type A sorting domain-containing protein [Flavobacterium sp.]|uniref:T9SS type A sorting domain-containing protein n=1 Tax=Flavobacterium sp. TaxID=239 RepID=UPI00262E2E41|nr:T9SS type A sorting domain-containing protein [Flavobacterium sp.]
MKKIYKHACAILLLGLLMVTSNALAQDDDFETPVYTKIRLGFHSHNNFYRQILIGFEEDNATEGIDPGFDAVNVFNLPNDFYFLCDNTELFIQGVGYYNTNNVYPLGVRSNSVGTITINIDATENWDPTQEVYIYDAVMNTFSNIKNGPFTANVGIGTFNDRFSLRFSTQSTLGVGNTPIVSNISVNYVTTDKTLSILNNSTSTATTVTLYNLNGQSVNTWNVSKMNQTSISLPVSNLSAGVYLVNVDTSNGAVTKKILLK